MEQIISIYNFEGIWLFDDYEKDVLGEPFVEGSSEIIFSLMAISGISSNKLVMTFSDIPFTGYQDVLSWKDSRECKTWNLYESKILKMEGWLCPVLLKYFDTPPKKLYVEMAESYL